MLHRWVAAAAAGALTVVASAAGVGVASASTASTASTAESKGTYQYGDRGATITKAQHRLDWLGYDLRTKEVDNEFFGRSTRVAIKAFQRKFFLPINGKLTRDTRKMLDKVGDDVSKLPRACLSERHSLCIDKTSKLLRYVVKGKVVLTLDVRFGVPGLDTPTGSFRVWYRDRYATSGINGPDVPRVPMPHALFFNGDIAVHYSSTFAASGYYPGGGSHGCVNVADLKGVSWLYNQIPVGTLVHVYWG